MTIIEVANVKEEGRVRHPFFEFFERDFFECVMGDGKDDGINRRDSRKWGVFFAELVKDKFGLIGKERIVYDDVDSMTFKSFNEG